jgi:CHASE3 domain sensor protein
MNNSASSDQISVHRKVQLKFGPAILTLPFMTLPFLALLVVGAVCCRSLLVSQQSDRWVRHTQEVLQNLKTLFSEVQSLECRAT